MKTKVIKFISVVTTMVFLISCQKYPTAKFTSSATTIATGTLVHFENSSVNGDSYKWSFPEGILSSSGGGSVSQSFNFDYTFNLPLYHIGGVQIIELEAFSKNGKKYNRYSDSIRILPPGGNGIVGFWFPFNAWTENYEVTINTATRKVLATGSSPTTCLISPTLSFSLPPGTYPYSAVETVSGQYWSGTITVIADTCFMKQL
jgi:hypothetical protein